MRGRILRVRPGHLSNFSGGAGYMPCIVYLSAPIAFILATIASVTIDKASRQERRAYGKLLYTPPSPVDAWLIASRCANTLTVLASVGAIGAIGLSILAMNMLKHDTTLYILAAWMLAAGPFFAAAILTLLQYFISRRWGGRSWYPLVSLLLLMVLMLLIWTLPMVLGI